MYSVITKWLRSYNFQSWYWYWSVLKLLKTQIVLLAYKFKLNLLVSTKIAPGRTSLAGIPEESNVVMTIIFSI